MEWRDVDLQGARGFNEAPACSPGKLASSATISLCIRNASMRPRPAHRGNRPSRAVARGAPPCFNEAPACSPGKRAQRRVEKRQIFRRFNEAPACSPGKRADARAPSTRFPRFNEAPACSPGKRTVPECDTPVLHRFNEAPACSPGKLHEQGRPDPARNRFNEAPACSPGKPAVRCRALGRALPASMRPRPAHRGNSLDVWDADAYADTASMRPRPAHRGNPQYGIIDWSRLPWLQ